MYDVGGFHDHLHSEWNPEAFASNQNSGLSNSLKSQFQQSDPAVLTGSVVSYSHKSLSVNTTTSPSSLSNYAAKSRPISLIHTETVESVERGLKDRHLMQSLPDDGGNRDQGKFDHFNVRDSPILSQKKRTMHSKQKRKHSNGYQKYQEQRSLQYWNRHPVAMEAHNIVDKVPYKKQPTNGNVMNWHQKNVSHSIVNHFRLTEEEKRWDKLRRYHARNKRVTISRDLSKLGGISLPPSSSLQDRGFPLWQNTSVVASHLPKLLMAQRKIGIDGISDTARSLNPDIIARGHVSIKDILCVEFIMFHSLPNVKHE